jgi:hypothetical protein
MINAASDFRKLLLFKFFAPTLFILLIAYLINRFDYSKMLVAGLFINICFWMYFLVLLMHLFWLGMLIMVNL